MPSSSEQPSRAKQARNMRSSVMLATVVVVAVSLSVCREASAADVVTPIVVPNANFEQPSEPSLSVPVALVELFQVSPLWSRCSCRAYLTPERQRSHHKFRHPTGWLDHRRGPVWGADADKSSVSRQAARLRPLNPCPQLQRCRLRPLGPFLSDGASNPLVHSYLMVLSAFVPDGVRRGLWVPRHTTSFLANAFTNPFPLHPTF